MAIAARLVRPSKYVDLNTTTKEISALFEAALEAPQGINRRDGKSVVLVSEEHFDLMLQIEKRATDIILEMRITPVRTPDFKPLPPLPSRDIT